MLEFIPAEMLKKTFEVFGHFYSINLKSGDKVDCRSVLEIVTRKSKPPKIDSLLMQSPNSIFIMMNPGSSAPIDQVNNAISEEQIDQLAVSLVPTKPDITQYQVMRVMHYYGWDHVRVLNISDMRDPKSGKFIDRFRNIEEGTGFQAHSIFSDERTGELQGKLKKKRNAPIVCAWGVSEDLEPLIQRCLIKMSGLPDTSGLTGLLKSGTDNKYFHPLPTLQTDKVKWVNNMVREIKT